MDWGVWTRSFTCPVSCANHRSAGDWARTPGLFLGTRTPPLLGWRRPRSGPLCVCMCVLFLAGSGGAVSRALCGAPHLFIRLFAVRSLLARPPLSWGSPVQACFFSLSRIFSYFAFSPPPVSPVFLVFRRWVPWALASCCFPRPARPPSWLFFPCTLVVSCFLLFLAPGANNLGAVGLPRPSFVFLVFFSCCALQCAAGCAVLWWCACSGPWGCCATPPSPCYVVGLRAMMCTVVACQLRLSSLSWSLCRCCLSCRACVLCPLVLLCGACGLLLRLGAVLASCLGLWCCPGSSWCVVSLCVGFCCVLLFSVVLFPVVVRRVVVRCAPRPHPECCALFILCCCVAVCSGFVCGAGCVLLCFSGLCGVALMVFCPAVVC